MSKIDLVDFSVVRPLDEGDGRKKIVGVELGDASVVPNYFRGLTLTIDGGSIVGRRALRSMLLYHLFARFAGNA